MSADYFLEIHDLKKRFLAGRPGLFARRVDYIHAVDGISLQLRRGEAVAVVGESGCGKSTLALTLMGLEEPTEGRIVFESKEITHANERDRKLLRQRIQMVFQDPYESLNPTQTIGEIVAEPLDVHGLVHTKAEREARVVKALEDAGLKPAADYMHRFPHQLSGGQRQRVVIAGALVLEPHLLIADEPVSMLDVSIRAEILNLLADLRQTRQISIILITHDLGTVGYFADRIAVMYLGRIVEIGPTAAVLANPQHPYTKALLSVVPVPNPRLRRERVILQGETPNPIHLPGGCRFHPRCPIAIERCKTEDPPYVDLGDGHQAACWLVKP
ncbi:MAG: ABC transporter ATP-binding protein [Anaerolineales bacterium]|jgi:oligopeptide/dipeptide ABC transporter ATP-binding protein|nr:ABC transporter ATP-binding protein [Anaerolineales bacterium]MDX9937220.1 ABC transporter ATP-binding protein [Anaerolineales bacterium]WKZ51695.1 MAG: ABC transporter ATP-binding protein [Anaerolineales bacterium]GER77994.1 peptide ABC transporter substrate-binding protein [Candidatus Denitrolinea symbiosum]